MSKTHIISKHMKKILSFLMICLIGITLTGCDSSNRRATGDLSLDDIYATAGNYSITVGELYDNLRYSATSYIEDAVYKFLYEDEIQEVKDNVQKYEDKFKELILKDIYDTTDEEEIAELTEKETNKRISEYVDEMYLKGYKISKDDIKNQNFTTLYSYYYLEVAKYVAAYNKLAEEFTVKEDGTIDFGTISDDSYFTKKNVIDWYEANYTNKGDVTAILVRFVSTTEAANVLKAFGIKTYDGNWYQIKLDESECGSKVDYDKYYDNYKVNPAGEDGISSIELNGNGKATILKIFVEIYNYIYTFREPITYDNELNFESFSASYTGLDHLKYYNYVKSIIDKDGDTRLENEENPDYDPLAEYNALVDALKAYNDSHDGNLTVMDNERLNKYNSSLATYIYDSLQTEASEEGKTFTQYTCNTKAYGDYYYLIFKIDQEEDPELYVENDPDDENDDDDTEIEFTNNGLLQTILMELFEDKLIDTYITTEFDERCKKAKLSIYDSVIELEFMQSSSTLAQNYEKTKKSNNNYIVAVKYQGKTKKISVSDAYNYLEPLYGPQQAMSLLFDKYIKDTDYYKDLEKDYDNYISSIESMLNYFANDYYSAYGYPASLGKYNFMMLYYHTANIDEAVRNFMMVSDAQNAFLNDFLTNYEGDSFFEKLQQYSDLSYDKYYSLTATGIEVYVDLDEDGEADTLDPTNVNDCEILELANELMTKAIHYIKTNVEDYSTALSNLISDYNDSSRIESTNPTTLEYRWAKYRKAGLYIKSTSIGSVTNTTDGIEQVIVDRIKALYANEGIIDNNGFTSPILDNKPLQTETGYTLLLLTDGSNPSSAKFDDEDKMDLYESIPVLLNNQTVYVNFTLEDFASDKATVDQIKVYVLDYLLFKDVYSLPESTTTALDTFVLPLIQRYTSTAGQYIRILNALGDIDFKITEAVSPADNAEFNGEYTRGLFLDNYMTIQQNVADDYDLELYPNWWNEMYEEVSE